MTSSAPRHDIRDIALRLNARIEEVAARLNLTGGAGYRANNILYPLNPTRSDRRPGSFVIHLSGARRGWWRDYGDGEAGGDALELVAYIKFGGDKSKAMLWALDLLGLAKLTAPQQEAERAKLSQEREKADKIALRDRERMRASARALWLRGMAAGELGYTDLYLKARGIDMLARLGALPRCARDARITLPKGWAPQAGLEGSVLDGEGRARAILLAVNDARGHCATHRIYVYRRPDGALVKLPLVSDDARAGCKSKFVYGSYPGGSIRVHRGASGKRLAEASADEICIITEGFENACGVACDGAGSDDDHRVLAAVSLGNLGQVELPDSIRHILLIGENDAHAEARASFERACAQHHAKGRQVRCWWPPAHLNDVNDLILAGQS